MIYKKNLPKVIMVIIITATPKVRIIVAEFSENFVPYGVEATPKASEIYRHWALRVWGWLVLVC